MPKKLKALSERPLNTDIWEGNLFQNYYVASDAKVLIDVTCVVGPMIKRAEKLFRRKIKAPTRQGTPEIADQFIDRILSVTPIPASELGWTSERYKDIHFQTVQHDVLWIVSDDRAIKVPILADYAKLIDEFTGYDQVALMGTNYGDPVGFYRKGELAAVCAPLRDVEVRKAA